jgi:hypothetical protein
MLGQQSAGFNSKRLGDQCRKKRVGEQAVANLRGIEHGRLDPNFIVAAEAGLSQIA